MNNEYEAPDPYAAHLKQLREQASTLRTASSTPESRFEDRYKKERDDEVTETAAELVVLEATKPPVFGRLTAAEEADMTPPPAYDAAIKTLHERERRR